MRRLGIAALCGLLAACGTLHEAPRAATFVVVRHAEKANDDPRDPSLTSAGIARAERLARMLADASLAGVYATALRRTQATALPSARAHELVVTNYAADEPPSRFAQALRARHASGTVLVVGHSNTVPDIVAALCECEVEPIADDDYGNLYRVHRAADGPPVLVRTRY